MFIDVICNFKERKNILLGGMPFFTTSFCCLGVTLTLCRLQVGKTLLIQSLVKHYTKQNLSDVRGPITVVSGMEIFQVVNQILLK